jgi:hypothetical protein
LIEEFLAKSNVSCSQRGNIKEVSTIIGMVRSVPPSLPLIHQAPALRAHAFLQPRPFAIVVLVMITSCPVQTAFKMFLGITAQVTNWSADGNEFSLVLDENPVTDFVELPDEYSKLW